MTLHSTMKIAGLPADGTAAPVAGGAAADLFTQLLSTLVVPGHAGAAETDIATAMPGAISLKLPAIQGFDEDSALPEGEIGEEDLSPEDEALALAGLFALPAHVPPSATQEAPAPVAAPVPVNVQMAPEPAAPQTVQLSAAQSPATAAHAAPVAQRSESGSADVNPEAIPSRVDLPATTGAIPAELKPALAALLPRNGAGPAAAQANEGPNLTPDRPAPEAPHPSTAPHIAHAARIDGAPLAPIIDGLQAAAVETVTDMQAGGFDLPAEVDMAIEQQLDLATDSEWLDQLAKDISRTADKEGTLRFRLNPETLGTLKVEVAQTQAGASVRLTADTESARAIIADAQPRLISEARAQGVRIAETHVDVGTGAHQGSDDARRNRDEAERQTFLRTASGDVREEDHSERTAKSGSDRYA